MTALFTCAAKCGVVVDHNVGYEVSADGGAKRLPEGFWKGVKIQYITRRPKTEHRYSYSDEKSFIRICKNMKEKVSVFSKSEFIFKIRIREQVAARGVFRSSLPRTRATQTTESEA